jgi:hypothetical protein
MKKWTITSKTGQILYGELDGDLVVMSSAKGNHGQINLAEWQIKVDQMIAAGYTVKIA